MLSRFRPVNFRPIRVLPVRSFTTSFVRFNNNVGKKPETNETSNEETKRRPLSRVAIGGTQDNKKFRAPNSIELASWRAVVILVILGGFGTYLLSNEKEKIRLQKEAENNRGVGKPLVGGKFNLIDTEGKPFTDENLKNDEKIFSIIYFGFTHCPDVCPEELDKLGEMLSILDKDKIKLQSIFITCDPARDSPEVIKTYLEDFHPSIIGLTGTYEAIKNCCKKYRVYFSTPPNVKPGQDYLVDHSIFFYLMDSEGNFVDVIGREVDSEEGAEKIKKYVDSFITAEESEKRKEGWLGFLYK